MQPSHVAAPVGATQLGREWTPTLRRTCNTGAHQPVERYRRTVAVVVPYWWHQWGLGVIPAEGPEHAIGSGEAKPQVSELLTKVREHHRHYVITADGYAVVSLVPAEWVEAVVAHWQASEWASMSHNGMTPDGPPPPAADPPTPETE